MIDVKTIIFLQCLSNFVMAIFLLALYFIAAREDRRLKLYIWAKLIQSVSWGFIAWRTEIPLFLSVAVGNPLLFSSLAMETYVLTTVCREPKERKLYGLILLGIVSALTMMIYFDQPFIRYFLHSATVTFFSTYIAVTLFRLPIVLRTEFLTSITAFIVALVSLAKGISHLIAHDNVGIFEPNLARSIFSVAFLLMAYLWPFLFLLMRYEKQHLQNVELNATRDKIFSVISHDLRSPFNSILGFSTMILQECEEKNYENVKEYTRYVHTSADKSFNLLNNLLHWLQIQRGNIQIKHSNILLKDVLVELSGLFEVGTNEKKLTFETQHDENFSFTGDKFMFETIMRNLISNAIKFSNEGDRVLITAATVQGLKRISVEDSGIGISSEQMKVLFDPKAKLTQMGTNSECGSGLGLKLVKEFVDQNDWQLEVNSEQGKGSVFTILLPENTNDKHE